MNDQLKDKVSAEEKVSVEAKIKDVLAWIEVNAENGETEEFEAKQKEIEQIWNPIASMLRRGYGGGVWCVNVISVYVYKY